MISASVSLLPALPGNGIGAAAAAPVETGPMSHVTHGYGTVAPGSGVQSGIRPSGGTRHSTHGRETETSHARVAPAHDRPRIRPHRPDRRTCPVRAGRPSPPGRAAPA